jgi:tetratricopeptide (TPR) repeat protein
MWTYLILFLGITALVAVFIRRTIIVHLKKKKVIEEALEPREKEKEIIEETPVVKVSKADKSKIEVLLEEADALLKKGEEDEAIKVFVQALAIDNNHLDTLQKLAMLYLQKQMLGAAAALFKQLSDLTQDPLHYSHLGFALYQQSSFEEARDAYQKSVDLDPSRPQRFVSLAQVYRSLAQHQNAIIALNKAIELDAENLEFFLLLANIYAELNNIEEAEMALKTVLEKDPENQDALDLLKKIGKELNEK